MEQELLIWVKFLRDVIEVISFFATIFGMAALIFGFKTYRTSAKQLNVQVIVASSTRFHQILKRLKPNRKTRMFWTNITVCATKSCFISGIITSLKKWLGNGSAE